MYDGKNCIYNTLGTGSGSTEYAVHARSRLQFRNSALDEKCQIFNRNAQETVQVLLHCCLMTQFTVSANSNPAASFLLINCLCVAYPNNEIYLNLYGSLISSAGPMNL